MWSIYDVIFTEEKLMAVTLFPVTNNIIKILPTHTQYECTKLLKLKIVIVKIW